VPSLSGYNGLNSPERLTAEVKTAGCLPHKIEDELPRVSNGFDWYEPEVRREAARERRLRRAQQNHGVVGDVMDRVIEA
jgi:hypothetical protein